MTNLIQTLISGLSLGSIYALIALGYTMVYGIAKMLNFAHGDVIMVGAYSGIVAVAQLGLSPWVTVIVSIAVCAVLGVVIEFCAYKPLRQAAPLSVLITAIGVSYLLQNAALLLFGSQQMAYPTLVKLGSFTVGGEGGWHYGADAGRDGGADGGADAVHRPDEAGQGHAGGV